MDRSRYAKLALFASLLACVACGGAPGSDSDEATVDLVVLVTVDQLPNYLFERYDSLYTGGFRRLLQQGRSYTRAVHDHAATVTSTGHATLATGMLPARHGVVDNDWYEQVEGEWRQVPSVDDEEGSIIGVPGKVGMSPRNLRASGLPDWIQSADPAARVVSVSGKRTASTLIAGQTGDAYVYYFEDDVGRFVTSTYYRQEDPSWLMRFNQQTLAQLLADSLWECSLPPDVRSLARADAVPYENRGMHTSFPHRAADEVRDTMDVEAYFDWWDHTPKLDRAILAFAKQTISSLQLGTSGHVDYLAVGLSQLDRVGHYYGPLSLEQLDNILHVDRLLAEFFDYLDEQVGAGRYVVAFTSDHGVVQLPAYRRELGLQGRQVRASEIREDHRVASERTRGAGDDSAAQSRVIHELEQHDYVADVMTLADLSGPESPDSFVALYQRSYYPGRVAGVLAREGLVLRLTEGMHSDPEPTTHGSPYLYDRHIPLIFMGGGILTGSSDEPVRTVDVAPTLARLVGVPFPDDLDGRPLDVRAN
jgi:predicted AlkP superfamily pyrophosphatase or phosphodiesterase